MSAYHWPVADNEYNIINCYVYTLADHRNGKCLRSNLSQLYSNKLTNTRDGRNL